MNLTEHYQELLKEYAECIAYISEHYFHKTRSWLSQRINGAIVNGQPATFKPEEVRLSGEALQDIGRKIAAVNLDSIVNN